MFSRLSDHFRLSLRTAVFALCINLVSLPAQPIPKLNSISQEWVQRGREVELIVTGENIGTATGFLISGDPGVSAALQARTDRASLTIESSKGGVSSAEV